MPEPAFRKNQMIRFAMYCVFCRNFQVPPQCCIFMELMEEGEEITCKAFKFRDEFQ